MKLLPAWHGTKPQVLDSLFSTGYANLATTDNGFFGKGYYSAYEAEYSHRVYSKGALILNWVASYSPLPVIADDMQTLALEGKSNYSNYDAHFVPVAPRNPDNPDETVYYPCQAMSEQQYTEMVVFDSAALLPRYLVELQAELLKPPTTSSFTPVKPETPKPKVLKTETPTEELKGDTSSQPSWKNKPAAVFQPNPFLMGLASEPSWGNEPTSTFQPNPPVMANPFGSVSQPLWKNEPVPTFQPNPSIMANPFGSVSQSLWKNEPVPTFQPNPPAMANPFGSVSQPSWKNEPVPTFQPNPPAMANPFGLVSQPLWKNEPTSTFQPNSPTMANSLGWEGKSSYVYPAGSNYSPMLFQPEPKKVLSVPEQVEQMSVMAKKQNKIRQKEVQALLKWVTEGHLVAVETLLKKNLNLGVCTGTVTDRSDRTFKNITALQYAAWCLDQEMCELIMSYLDTHNSAIQLKALYVEPSGYSAYGDHYDIKPLIAKTEKYVKKHSKWNEAQRCQYWQKEVAGEQRNCPAWLIYTWSEEGQDVAWAKQDFSGKVKREYNKNRLHLWFEQTFDSGVERGEGCWQRVHERRHNMRTDGLTRLAHNFGLYVPDAVSEPNYDCECQKKLDKLGIELYANLKNRAGVRISYYL